MSSHEIAIVGMSGRYPDAENLDQFRDNLCRGVDSVRPLSEERLGYLVTPPSERFSTVASLRQIDAFDHAFFGISLREAEYMDPQQRMLLELACTAIENAGLALSEMRGSSTGVFAGASHSDFYGLIEVPDPTAVSGNLSSALAGRIAFQLGLHGPAMVIDTACSSSLVAVIEACDQLAIGRIDYALAGGINLFFAEDPLAGEVGITAPDGKCKTFDASADGSGWGEGGGVVLLTTLRRAREERLPVRAVIKGGAVNQDADRSNGITAPSPDAQTEVIDACWKRAGVEPESLGYIEAHGTGTVLGDPIEIQGLDGAFRSATDRKGFCPIGSVKTNIGHLTGAAGISGLTKVVLSLEGRQLFPSLHYREANPYIDFDRSAVYVNTELRPWELDGAEVRRAAVSSFGLSGTNAHLVVEEAPETAVAADATDRTSGGDELVTVSARSAPALERYLREVRSALDETAAPLADVAFTLNRGRDDHAHRFAAVAGSLEELRARLDEGLAEHPAATSSPVPSGRGVVFVFGDGAELDPERLERLAERFPAMAEVRERCAGVVDELGPCPELDRFVFQWGLYREWRRVGVAPETLIGTGPGAALTAFLQDRLDLRAALEKALGFRDREHRPDLDKLRQVADRLLEARPAPVFLEVGAGGELFGALEELGRGPLSALQVFPSLGPQGDALAPALRDLHAAGVDIDWEAYYEGRTPRRIALPTYPFERTPCWNPNILRQPVPAAADPEDGRKVRRNEGTAADVALSAGAGETEVRVARIWAEALKLEELDLDADYFDLGGNSLNGMQVISRLEEELGIEVDFDDIYDYPTLRELAARLDELAGGAAADPAPAGEPSPAVSPGEDPRAGAPSPTLRMPPIRRAPGEEAPLSFTEQRLWFLDQFEPGSPFYNIPFALRIRGPLDAGRVVRAFGEIVRRHEILRTTFPTVDGRPERRVHDDLRLPVTRIDLGELSALRREQELERIAAGEAATGFDLERGPLARARIVRLSGEDYALLVTTHHVISDLWSMNLLVRELTLLYAASAGAPAPVLPELPVQYSDFARTQRAWLRGETLERMLSFWRDQLEGVPPLVTLPTDRPRPAVQAFRGRNHPFSFPPELTRRLRAFAREEDATLFMVLMAGFQALLHRYTGERKIPVGTPIAGRGRTETENLIGFFTNTLVIATDVGGDPTARELLGRVRDRALGAYAHQEMPFEKLLEEVHPERSLSHSPLFQVMLVLQNIAIDVPPLDGLSIEASEPDGGTTQFDLTVSLREEGDGLTGRVQLNTDLYVEETVQRMVEHLESLLDAMTSTPDRSLASLPMWRPGEREMVVAEWNDTARELPGGDRCLHELVREQASRTPDRIAVVSGDRVLTYSELAGRAAGLARSLVPRNVGPDAVVAVYAERSVELSVALLAVLDAGAAYLPLDPETPRRRLDHLLEHSGTEVVLTRGALVDRFTDRGVEVVDLDAPNGGEAGGPPRIPVAPGNAAYVIYTSGTTGQPKGVVVPHRGIVNRLAWMQETYRLDTGDRVLQKTPYTFDVSLWELFWPLLAGATLVMARPGGHRDPRYLAETVRERRVTTLHFVPSMLNPFLQEEGLSSASSLRRIICSGEALGLDQVERFSDVLGEPVGTELHNLYGPTEASVDVSHWHCQPGRAASTVPIGRPIANTSLYVLDGEMEPVPVGAAGELHIGGVGLARGYAGDPVQTGSRFVPDPFSDGGRLYRTGDRARFLADGAIEFLGRLDHQVKIRGFRIETGEIEAALGSHDGVEQSVVVAAERGGHQSLVAYVVPSGGQPPSVTELRAHLAERLPGYMIPAQTVVLDALPLTSSGKVDRKALPAPSGERPELESGYVEPRNRVEETLAEIWSGLLAVDRVGVRDNFFQLGGDSILSIQAVARAKERGIVLTPRQMFERQTIAELAAVAGEAHPVEAEQGPVSGPVELTPIQRWLLEDPPADLHHWNQAVMLAGDGRLEREAVERALEALIGQHDALRHRFALGETTEQRGLPSDDGSLRVTWEDLSDLPEGERTAAIGRHAREAQEELDFEAGPLVRAVGMGWPGGWRLLLVIHHLVVDGVSWRILLEDLEKGYRQVVAGDAPDLGPKTTSYRYWAERLTRFAREDRLRDELGYWLDGARRDVLPLPRDGEGENREGSARAVEIDLDPERTAQLLREAPRAYSNSVEEVLLTALSRALLRWGSGVSGRSGRVLIDLEGHGREPLFEEVDLLRTVGWFTALYPLCLPVHLEDPAGEALKRTKEIVRGVPHGGVGYGVLRYLGDEEVARRLAEMPRTEVLFNYLGRLDEVLEPSGSFRPAPEEPGPLRSPGARRTHPLDVGAVVSDGRLRMRFTYSPGLHERDRIERLAQGTRKRLEELIGHCLDPQAGEYTPSDFPDEALSEQELGEIFTQLGRS